MVHKLKCRSHHIVYSTFGVLPQAFLVAMNKFELLISPKIVFRTILYYYLSPLSRDHKMCAAVGKSTAWNVKKIKKKKQKSIYRKIEKLNGSIIIIFFSSLPKNIPFSIKKIAGNATRRNHYAMSSGKHTTNVHIAMAWDLIILQLLASLVYPVWRLHFRFE